jgi:hypothetical protein
MSQGIPRQNWSRPLPRPIIIPNVMTLKTLADVRTLIERHLPVERRQRATWRYVAIQLDKAARGADPTEVVMALRVVRSIEGVECRPQ